MTSRQHVFSDIYDRNMWGSPESMSGAGSTHIATHNIRLALPHIVARHAVASILDIPCGDFNWMHLVPLEGVEYTGCDIVPALIEANKRNYPQHVFKVLDLVQSELPKVDLVFCRDCLVHLSTADVKQAIANIAKSGSTYIMSTTFPGKANDKTIATGGWAPYNLQLPPFAFPEPLTIVNEHCVESYPTFTDKSMGVWRIDDLANCMC